MDTPTPSLREQGIQALRGGNLDGAIDLLARAVMADGQDAEAQAFLGVAYSQKGQHAQAQRALQTAIAMQPQEARYPFNLGVAREQAGDGPGATEAYREALRLNPEHAQAKARLQALEARAGAPGAAASSPTGGSTRWLGQQPPAAPAAAPAAPAAPTAPWLAGQQAPGASPTGTVQCPSCKQWSKPGLSCEWCSASLGRAPVGSSGTPLPPGGPGGYSRAEAAEPAYSYDSFDIGQAFKDWVQVLISPQSFFKDQEGREGLKAPMAFVAVYWLLSCIAAIPLMVLRGVGGALALPVLAIGFVVVLPFGLLCMFLWSGIVHGISRMFGGQASYAGSFRAAAYASGPWVLIGLVSGLVSAVTAPQMPTALGPRGMGQVAPPANGPRVLFARAGDRSPFVAQPRFAQYGGRGVPGMPPGMPGRSPFGGSPMSALGGSSPLGMMINLLGFIYYLALLGVGVFHIHRLNSGAAAGVVAISGVIAVVLFVGLFMVIGVALVAMLMGARAMGG